MVASRCWRGLEQTCPELVEGSSADTLTSDLRPPELGGGEGLMSQAAKWYSITAAHQGCTSNEQGTAEV